MVKRVLILLLVIGLLYFCYWAYARHEQVLKAQSGDFTCQGCDSPEEHARYVKENAGETSDRGSERKPATAGVAGEQAAVGTDSSTMVVSGDSSISYPPVAGATADAPVVIPTTGDPGAMPSGLPAGLPSRDSESPNAPNGLRFAGSGSYQWYRQGDLTYRIDTATGRSCIIYATKQQWRDPLVYSNGCGSNS